MYSRGQDEMRGGRAEFPRTPNKFPTVHIGKGKVRQNNGGTLLNHRGERLAASLGDERTIALSLEEFLKELPLVPVIFHDQYQAHDENRTNMNPFAMDVDKKLVSSS